MKVLGILVSAFVAISSALRGETAAEIEKIVAKLDTEYQAAVKANDADTMDRILADDFVLVIGNGKTFSKADLLESARDKTAIYEHQEELEQKVRVWGDTRWSRRFSGSRERARARPSSASSGSATPT